MADNIPITPGSGVSVATDDVSGVHHQKIIVEFGPSGSVERVTDTSPLPVSALEIAAARRTTDAIAAALQTDAIMSGLTALTPKFKSQTVAQSQTDVTVVAAVVSVRIRVLALVVHVGATATSLTFESDGASDTRLHKVPAGANGGQVLPPNPWGWFQTVVGEGLIVTTSAGSDSEITLAYVEVA